MVESWHPAASITITTSVSIMRRQFEAAFQQEVVWYLQTFLQDRAFFFSVPNEGRRSLVNGAQLKRMGLRSGVADIVVVWDGKVFFIELKAGKNKQTDAQIAFHHDCIVANTPYAVCRTLEEVVAYLRANGVPLGGSL